MSFAPYEGEAFPNRRSSFGGGERLYVIAEAHDRIAVVDRSSGSILGAAPIGRNPVEVDGPHAVQVDEKNGFLYVGLAYPATGADGVAHSHGTSTRAGYVQKLALDELRVVGETRVDSDPAELALNADGSRLIVTHFNLLRSTKSTPNDDEKRSNISVIDTGKMEPLGGPEPLRIRTCAAPHDVVISSDANARAFVVCQGEDSVAIVDWSAAPSVQRVALTGNDVVVGAPSYQPYTAALSPRGTALAVGTVGASLLFLFDLTTALGAGRPIHLRGVPGRPFWSADGARLTIPIESAAILAVVDATSGEEMFSRDLRSAGCSPIDTAVDNSSQRLFVLCADTGEGSVVLTLDAEGTDVGSIERWNVGTGASRIALEGRP